MLFLSPGKRQPLRQPQGPGRLMRRIQPFGRLRRICGRAGADRLCHARGPRFRRCIARGTGRRPADAAAITPIILGDSIIVVGTGLIGLLLIQLLRASAPGILIALDIDPSRRDAAMKFGADAAFDPAAPDSPALVRALTSGRGADHAFEAVGATTPIARPSTWCARAERLPSSAT